MSTSHDVITPSSLEIRVRKKNNATRSAIQIALIYLVVAGLWICFSNRIFFHSGSDSFAKVAVGSLNDWLFAAVTTAGLFGLLRSTLERRRAEEEKLQSFIEHAPVPLAMLDRNLCYVMTSQRWRADFNLGERELVGVCHYDVFPQLSEKWREAHQRALRGETIHGDLDSLTFADGSVVWLRREIRPWRNAMGAIEGILIFAEDVSASRRMREALRESETRFREVVETIGEVFWISDVEKSRILYVSPTYEKIWGHSCQELYQSGRSWLSAIHTDDRERVLHAALTKQTEGTYDETYRVVRPDGSIRWIRDRAYPVKDASGALVRIAGCACDITEKKTLQEQFMRAQRLEAIGTLASGVAHDLNNILAPVLMVSPLLKQRVSAPEDVAILGIVEASAQRGANVVRQLLTFSRGIAGERGPIQLRHLVKEMTSIMNETFPREIGIVHQVPSNLWPVVGDATQLHQVLMNLCVNARDAMADGGRLSIDAENADFGPAEVALHPGVTPGRFVVITVSDTGHGISEENKTKIFEPFFTTKEVGKGTGLGLSTVLGIVKSHGGFVTVESRLGRGTKFRVHLPTVEMTGEFAAVTKRAEKALGRGELVLIVDDEVNVRQAMQRVLEHNGYRVLTAANGREGLGLYLLQRETVRIVVTDLMMPEMNGVALVRALRDLSFDLPILAATGLISGERREALASMGVTELLPKPYTSFELIDAVARALSQAASDGAAPSNACDDGGEARLVESGARSL